MGYRAILIGIILIPVSLMSYKLFVLDYPLSVLVPSVSYRVDLSMEIDGHGNDISVSTYLPSANDRQSIGDEQSSSGTFALTLEQKASNRVAKWEAAGVTGRQTILYTFSARPRHIRYEIPEKMPIPKVYPRSFRPYLEETPGIQVNDPLIEKALNEILLVENPGILESLTAIHRYIQDKLANKDFSGYTDALTALKLEEASCNGKSRLFAAMARKLNLPARLAGGLILEQGAKRVTHQWVEIFVNGHWIPFDTINDHFSQIPNYYLKFYTGDQVMFKHTANVNFQYIYKMTRRLVPQSGSETVVSDSPLSIMNLYAMFEQVGISQNLLKIILMLPFGVLVTAVLRNVVGLETFGTFLPALIAAAARETGFAWGMIGFGTIIMVVALLGHGLERLRLLHTPKLAIMMTSAILVMMTLSIAGVRIGWFELAHITLFPIAILTITAERFVVIQTEQGFIQAFRLLLTTFLAVGLCYWVMDSLFLQSLVLVFPEFLLVLIGLNLWLGKWIGIRLLEYIRFRNLIREGGI